MDHDAVQRWYNNADHSLAQSEGRSHIFKHYRIRVAQVFRDYDMISGRPEV